MQSSKNIHSGNIGKFQSITIQLLFYKLFCQRITKFCRKWTITQVKTDIWRIFLLMLSYSEE